MSPEKAQRQDSFQQALADGQWKAAQACTIAGIEAASSKEERLCWQERQKVLVLLSCGHL